MLQRLVSALLRRRPELELVLVPRDDPLREAIYRLRHEVYAVELGQHPVNSAATLTDDTDGYNVYIAAVQGGAVAGFVAVTPPGRPQRLERHGIAPAAGSYEMRLLTVVPGWRGRGVGGALVYAATRYVQASGGSRIEAVARVEVLPAYQARGMRVVSDERIPSGKLSFVHIAGDAADLPDDLRPGFQWRLPFPRRAVVACHHGGQGLEPLDPQGISADVLDAWFPPAPAVLDALALVARDVGITPHARCTDLLSALARTRGVDPAGVLLGAGSSDLIYRCFWTWLTPASHVLLLHPTYAEYEHVLRAIGCRVTRLELSEDDGYALTPSRVPPGRYDLVVLTNPNSPTGVHSDVAPVVEVCPESTTVWVDETYIEYAGRERSVEALVEERPNLVVCKSMSKAYALSGLRVGYVCAQPLRLESVRARSPPWIVSRVAQRAAVKALESEAYYRGRYAETRMLRASLASCLRELGWDVVAGAVANFVMAHPPPGLDAAAFVDGCAAHKLYIRLIESTARPAIRVAVKDPETLWRLQTILRGVQHSTLATNVWGE